MLLLNDGKMLEIDDDRVNISRDTETTSLEYEYYNVYIDGEYYMQAFRIYMEHKQYLAFLEIIKTNPNVRDILGGDQNAIVVDMGIPDQQIDLTKDPNITNVVFKDYTEKVRNGISYFSDIITDQEKSGSFKNNYVRVEVLL